MLPFELFDLTQIAIVTTFLARKMLLLSLYSFALLFVVQERCLEWHVTILRKPVFVHYERGPFSSLGRNPVFYSRILYLVVSSFGNKVLLEEKQRVFCFVCPPFCVIKWKEKRGVVVTDHTGQVRRSCAGCFLIMEPQRSFSTGKLSSKRAVPRVDRDF